MHFLSEFVLTVRAANNRIAFEQFKKTEKYKMKEKYATIQDLKDPELQHIYKIRKK
jgi:hypothetical protein